MNRNFIFKYKNLMIFGIFVFVCLVSTIIYNISVNADVILPKKMENDVESNNFGYDKINVEFIDERQQYSRIKITYTYPSGFLSDKKFESIYHYNDDSGQHYCNEGNCTLNIIDSNDTNKWFGMTLSNDLLTCNDDVCVQSFYVNNLNPYSDIEIELAYRVWTGEKIDENSTYKEYKRVERNTFSSFENTTIELKILNPYYGPGNLCETKVSLLTDLEKNQVYDQVPYCKRQYNSYMLNEQSISEALDAAVEFVTRKPSNNKTLDLTGATKVDRLSDVISLSCDPFSDNKNQNKYYSVTTTNYPSDSDPVCSTICTELVTVIYGPPKAVKAGSCFDNEVTVKSSVVCDAKILKSPPQEPDISKLTTPKIRCNYFSGFTDQGGPDEDFDLCINSCDGGEYSQKCIDSCYGEIYGDKQEEVDININPMALSKDKFIPLKLASKNNSCPDIDPESKSFNVLNYNDLAEKVFNYYQQNVGGKYNNNGSYISWEKLDNCYWSNYASYYFTSKSKALRTVSGDYLVQSKLGTPNVYSNGKNKCGAFGYDSCWDSKASGYYYAAFDGFKKQSSSYGSLACGDRCYFYGDYTNATLNAEELVADYEKKLAEYQAAVDSCTSNAVCSNDTATFKVNVDTTNDDSDSNSKTGVMSACTSNVNSMNKDQLKTSTCFSWVGEHKQDSPNASGDVNIFEKLDGNCIGGNNINDDYFTTVDFPGTWINNKKGFIEYKEPDEKDFYIEHDNQFCIDRSFKNINSVWWNWHELNRTDEVKNTIKKESLFYNTLTNIREFGLFKWNFDVSCFFATDYEPKVSDCPNGKCGKVLVDNFKTRPASLQNLFVKTDINDVSLKLSDKNKKSTLLALDNNINDDLKPGRVTGYNWSIMATDYSLSNYTIAPTAYVAMIQNNASGIYKDDGERDYSITLTPKQIREIKKYNSDEDGYSLNGTYEGDITKGSVNENGIMFYKSSFLDKYTTVNVRPKQYGCNNLFNGLCNNSYRGFVDSYAKIDGLNIGK